MANVRRILCVAWTIQQRGSCVCVVVPQRRRPIGSTLVASTPKASLQHQTPALSAATISFLWLISPRKGAMTSLQLARKAHQMNVIHRPCILYKRVMKWVSLTRAQKPEPIASDCCICFMSCCLYRPLQCSFWIIGVCESLIVQYAVMPFIFVTEGQCTKPCNWQIPLSISSLALVCCVLFSSDVCCRC